MSRLKIISTIIAAISFLSTQENSFAHEMSETSASITVRDQAVDIRLSVDLIQWLSNVSPQSNSLKDPAEAMKRLVLAEKSLNHAKFIADGKSLPLNLKQFPNVVDVLNAIKEHGQGQHTRASVIMRASLPHANISKISLKLPEELGDVVATFNRPTTHYARRGGVAAFPMKSAQQ